MPKITKEEIGTLRTTSSDRALFNSLMQRDEEFKSAVEAVQSANPNMNSLAQAKLPTLMINRHYFGSWNPSHAYQDEKVANSAFNASNNFDAAQKKKEEGGLLSFAAETVSNVPRSAAEFGGGLLEAVTSPIETASNLLRAGVGAVETGIEKVTGFDIPVFEPGGTFADRRPGDSPEQQVAKSIGKFYVDRYGSVDSAAETLKEDPVGFAADIAGALSAAGAGLKAVGAGKVGTRASAAGRAVDPVRAAGKAGKVVTSPVRKAIKPTKAAERLVAGSLKLTKSQAKNIAKPTVAGMTPEKWILSKGIAGSFDDIMSQLDDMHRISKATLDDGLAGIAQTFDKTDDVSKILANLDDLYSGVPGLEDELAKVKALAKKDALTLSEFNETKRILDQANQIFAKSGDIKSSTQATGLSKLRKSLKEFIEDEAAKFDVDAKSLNKDTQVSKAVLDAMADSGAISRGNRVASLTDIIVATGATGVGGAQFGIGAIVAKKIAENPAVRTRFARMLNALPDREFSIVDKAIKAGNATPDARRIIQSLVQGLESPEDLQTDSPGRRQ